MSAVLSASAISSSIHRADLFKTAMQGGVLSARGPVSTSLGVKPLIGELSGRGRGERIMRGGVCSWLDSNSCPLVMEPSSSMIGGGGSVANGLF